MTAADATQWLEDHSAGDVLFAPDGVLLDYNYAASRMFRVPPEIDIRGQNLLQFCTHQAQFAEMMAALLVTGRLQNWDANFTRTDGTHLHVVVNLVANFDPGRELVSVRAHVFNITEWRRGHERIVFGQRAEAIGRLAGGIAHDFNNLLTVIAGHAERLVTALGLDDSRRRSASAIQEAAARAARLTRQLLAFGRRQLLMPEVVDPNRLVRSVEADVRRTFGRRIGVGVATDAAVPEAYVDPGQLEWAIETLVAYRVDAMPDGGTLMFRTGRRDVGVDRPEALAFVKPGTYVEIEIADSGPWIDADAQVRIFEPFYAVASLGSSDAGLGLAAVFGVIKQSGGYMWTDSRRPSGATFTILVPAHQDVPCRCDEPEKVL